MTDWIRIASLDDCPPGACREIVAANRIVALFNVEGTLYALNGICPHQGGPLGKGHLDGHCVTCPWHGWQLDVRSGQHQASPSLRHTTLPLRMEGRDVWVGLDDPI